MKKLPIGIQTLSEIINGGYVYVDKTAIALDLINSGKYYFLSRPRRFGKSLFVDTLKEIFSGNKTLFKGLYIEDKWDFEQTNPVLFISFGMGFYGDLSGLDERLRFALKTVERELDISVATTDPVYCFQELIWQAHQKYQKKVVILIDEYDKPILDNIIDKAKARVIRDRMKDFYSLIKQNDAFIQLVFITGVSKFSKMHLFSGLNNINDITLDGQFGNICGYTHQDLLTYFQLHLEDTDIELVRTWYNGYNFFGEKVYNPFDILLFLSNNKEFRNYWWGTGNPKFLIDLLQTKSYHIPDLVNYIASEEMLSSFDVDTIELEALLWQTGYLTIKEKIHTPFGVNYQLTIPNKEIQTSLNSLFITYLTGDRSGKFAIQHRILKALQDGNLEDFQTILKRLFASIAHQNYTKNNIADYEGYYASVLYAYLSSLGLPVIPEDTTNKGRIDLTIQLPDKAFIFEFKVVETATGTALAQIKKRQYYQKYTSYEKIYLVGIEFGKSERNIVGWETELLSNNTLRQDKK